MHNIRIRSVLSGLYPIWQKLERYRSNTDDTEYRISAPLVYTCLISKLSFLKAQMASSMKTDETDLSKSKFMLNFPGREAIVQIMKKSAKWRSERSIHVPYSLFIMTSLLYGLPDVWEDLLTGCVYVVDLSETLHGSTVDSDNEGSSPSFKTCIYTSGVFHTLTLAFYYNNTLHPVRQTASRALMHSLFCFYLQFIAVHCDRHTIPQCSG